MVNSNMKFFEPEPRIFAHRGFSSDYPENSILSFRKAVELGSDVIETDINMTKDNRLVIFHDMALERTTGAKGRLIDHTFADLKQIDIGYNFTNDGKTYPFRGKNLGILLLEELLEEFPGQRFNLELKFEDHKKISLYTDIIKKMNAQNRVLTASESDKNLHATRKLIPEMATSSALRESITFLLQSKTGFIRFKNKCDYFAMQVPEYYLGFKVLNRSFVKNAHRLGLRVHVWTINKEDDMIRMIDMGVDGIMSDNLSLLKKVYEEYG